MTISIILEELLIPNHSLTVKVKNTVNKNDSVSSKAVSLSFYDGNNKIGIVSISGIDTNEPFIYNLEVFKEYRGKGYSKEIMKYIIDKYNANCLSVRPDNKIAINLYKKFGFKIVQTYYWDKEKLYYMIKQR